MTEFTPDRYGVIVRAEDKHFWFLARRAMVLELIRRFHPKPVETFADVGCGSGYNLTHFKTCGKNLLGIDRLVLLSPHIKTLASDTHLIAGDVQALPLGSQSIDMMTSLDVLEHVDDQKMLRELFRTLKAGSILIITVPAQPWLWSQRDIQAGHKRRYTKIALTQIIEQAGFTIRYVNYHQFLLFPLVVISRFLWHKKQFQTQEENPGKITNWVLLKISMFENWLARKGIRFAWGSSLVVVAQKP
ncbi:class I SAM-dependent methyltransferase [Porticoccus sp.]|uniref:class I SAM-dependent methyltransferase n=1 Tax=Porticoccus sp. TaxID=2024853 RepID=UPI003F69F0EC